MSSLSEVQNAIIIIPNITVWTGKKKLTAEDFGINTAGLPPDELASFGMTQLVDREGLKKLESLRAGVRRDLLRFSTSRPRLNGYVTDEKNKTRAIDLLEKARTEFEISTHEFVSRFDQAVASQCQKYPQWEKAIRSALPRLGYVADRLIYGYEIQKIQFLNEDLNAPENQDILADIHGWAGEVFRDIAKMAQEALEGCQKKDAISLRSVNALRDKVVDKLTALRFCSVRVGPILNRVEAVCSALPKVGPIRDKDVSSYLGMLYLLSDVSAITQYADSVLTDPESVMEGIEEIFEPQAELGLDIQNTLPVQAPVIHTERRAICL